jgi:hypothetical protein
MKPQLRHSRESGNPAFLFIGSAIKQFPFALSLSKGCMVRQAHHERIRNLFIGRRYNIFFGYVTALRGTISLTGLTPSRE